MTRQEAIEALVEQDVARWGEAEREASRTVHGSLSHGLALNALWARAQLADVYPAYARDDVTSLDIERQRVMTADDRASLRKGG